MRISIAISCLVFSLAPLLPMAGTSAKEPEPIASAPVRGSIHVITGEGGNIGVFIGPDGTFLIDDKFAPLSDQIRARVKAIGGDDPRFVFNTHYHADHTGGNEVFGKQGSTIVSHENVRRRLEQGTNIDAFEMVTPPAPAAALPVITFDRDIRFHLNGQTIDVIHLPAAHTDGDSLVVFRPANVIHAGDAWFNGFYPFIDTAHGGTLQGAIAAVDTILSLADTGTRIIPGHGPVGGVDELRAYRTMLATAQQRLSRLKAQGMTAQEAAAARPLADLESIWGDGLFSGKRWIEIIWEGI